MEVTGSERMDESVNIRKEVRETKNQGKRQNELGN
jgi:hypothetical protein